VEIEEAGQPGILVVSKEPGVAVNRGREEKAPVERLENEIILPIVQARRQAYAVVFEPAAEARRNLPGQGPGPVVRRRPLLGMKTSM